MAWNEPGPGRDPWNQGSGGKRGSGSGPPDLEELLKRLRKRFLRGEGGSGAPPGNVIAMLAAALVVAWVLSGLYSVGAQQRAVVLRFGALVATVDPGLHWHLPWPIESAIKADVTPVRQAPVHAALLTADQNLVEIDATVQFRVSSASDFLFSLDDPDKTVREATTAALREVVAQTSMDSILGDGQRVAAARARARLQSWLDSYHSGLIVIDVSISQAAPPDAVQDAFADAIKAVEDQKKQEQDALAYANDRLPRARGEAATKLAQANAYAEQLVARAQGEVDRFSALYEEYRHSPEITRRRLYIDTMAEVLSHTRKVVVDSSKGGPSVNVVVPSVNGAASSAEGDKEGGAAPHASPPRAQEDNQEPGRSRDRGENR
jgi:membrane protease subunit HflK